MHIAGLKIKNQDGFLAINILNIKKGDKVSVLDDIISGIVTAIDGDRVTILSEDDFEIQFTKNELVVENKILDKSLDFNAFSKGISEKEDHKPIKKSQIKSKERIIPPMEVDLHIHQLIKNSKRMSNYEMLTLQLDTAKYQLEFAIKKRIQKIVFIHGIGEGILRTELEYLFKRYDNLKFYDANYQKYGRGAVEVYIFQNKLKN